MFDSNLFSIDKLLKKYGEEWDDWRALAAEPFEREDVNDARSLALKLNSNRRHPLTQYIFDRLSETTKSELDRFTSSDAPENNEFLDGLVRDLNRLCEDPDLYDENRFQDVVLSSAPQVLLDGLRNEKSPDNTGGQELRRLNRILLEEAYPQELSNKRFQLSKIQLTNHKGYEYAKDRSNKYFYLQCLLHGAAKVTPHENPVEAEKQEPAKSTLFEDSVRDFLIKELQLLFGMYCFIDPKAADDEDASSFYLLGSLLESDLKPSFTFPLFVNARNIRNNREFHKLPDEWLAFYLHLNTVTREQISFKDDLFKFFGQQQFRRNELEQGDNFFYASSGEMDHTILQWLFCSLGPDLTLDQPFAIALAKILPDEEIRKRSLSCESASSPAKPHERVIKKIAALSNGEFYLNFPKEKEDENASDTAQKKRNIKKWFQCFGLLNDSNRIVPTERLLAAIEFFYFHVKFWQDSKIGKNTEHYFSLLENGDHFYGDFIRPGSDLQNSRCISAVDDFIKRCESTLPVSSKSYGEIKDKIEDDDALQKGMNELLDSYLRVLEVFAKNSAENARNFALYGRFNILSHFFQRNVLPIYNPLLKEQTCRGFVIIPIFSNPHKSASDIKNVGYFLGLIKDSDAKGRCYFNWRTHSDNETKSETGDYFYNEYLFHLQNFVYNLGFKEVKQIYYKGIEEKHVSEVKRQASRSAISQVMARNMSHNIGSHVLSRYKASDDFSSIDGDHRKQYLGEAITLNSGANIAAQRAYFNEYLKNRMDFLADIATTDPTLETALYLVKDVLSGIDKNRILLDRISGLDSNIEFDIAVRYADESGTIQSIANDEHIDDPLLAIPNDILGCQAFYIILENIIRNVTKHSRAPERQPGTPLFFEISILVKKYPGNSGYYEISVYDSFYETVEDMDKLVANRNELIASPVLDPKTNRLRESGLGSIEMLVCAAYLRRVPLDSIESDDFYLNDCRYSERDGLRIPNILYAYAQPHDTDEGKAALGYTFFVRIPQRVLIFDDDNSLGLTEAQRTNCSAKGITILATKSFRKHWEYGHEILVWLNADADLKDFYDENKTALPQRVLKRAEFQAQDLKVDDIDKIWRIYLDKLLQIKGFAGVRLRQSDLDSSNGLIFPPNAVENLLDIFLDAHHACWATEGHKPDVYYEMGCSHHRTTKLDFDQPEDLMRYIETVLTKVVVIDERIQANLEIAKYADEVPFQQYFERMGVLLPTKDQVNLNQLSFTDVGETSDSVRERLAAYLSSAMNSGSPGTPIKGPADFCVLHLGVIEKLCGSKITVDAKIIAREIEFLVGKDNLDKVLITTGRGKPTNISSQFRYIPLAIIQNCLETLFDKSMLVASLYNARKSK